MFWKSRKRNRVNYYNEFDRNRVDGRPLAIDLYCGLGGWSEGLIAEGYQVIGFDITRHQYGESKYPGQLVIQDVLTLHGSQFRDAAVIVASPPCQLYSWLAMPWSRSESTAKNLEPAKALRRKWETEGPDNRLFDACFRIQREACEAAGRFIPLIVENVRGAQEWVGQSSWNAGSFHLWGDIPALMPKFSAAKVPSESGRRTDVGKGARFTSRDCGIEGVKQGNGKGDWFSKDARAAGSSAIYGSKSPERKRIAAEIAKIPLPLSEHIARVFKPRVST